MTRVIALVAVAVAAVVGCTLWIVSSGTDPAAAQERDVALSSGRTAIATLNTLDYRELAAGLRRWESAATGTLRDEVAGMPETTKERVRDARAVSRARVVDAALTAFDGARATVIALVDVEVARDGAEPVVKPGRYTAELVRTADGWKARSVGPIPVGANDAFTASEAGKASFAPPRSDETAQVQHEVSAALAELFTYELRADRRTAPNADAARRLLTGDAVGEYDALLDRVRAAAAGRDVRVSAEVVAIGVQRLAGDRATLLAFLDQASVDAATDRWRLGSAQLRVTAEHTDRWRIASLRAR